MKVLDFAILVNSLLGSRVYIDCIAKINEFGFNDKYEESTLAKWLKPELW
jgi:hypothetical protein